MNNVTKIPVNSRTPSLLDAYRQALADGYNKTVDCERLDLSTVNVMVGFLAAATIALRLIGNEHWAARFEECATMLEQNWSLYEKAIPALCAELDARAA
ncbi:hypothetical protein HA052_19685 [Chromobacterium haemolyticum]|uniref:DUF3144 domain-containing protein n=1 Tax=Chromobacterium fluminis TaxID=3044269 RepID=A0ABX0LCS2_9NEIS|nr:hypothetical protein [Chromobacterium haemolyticum]NHR07416.1 hypothetical protein [Chromobacterium haemolyticum]